MYGISIHTSAMINMKISLKMYPLLPKKQTPYIGEHIKNKTSVALLPASDVIKDAPPEEAREIMSSDNAAIAPSANHAV